MLLCEAFWVGRVVVGSGGGDLSGRPTADVVVVVVVEQVDIIAFLVNLCDCDKNGQIG